MNNFSRGGGFGSKKGGFGGGSRGGFAPRFNRNDGDDRKMFDATCGECGNDCQVPFRPNGRKPVLCSNCFRKDEDGNDRFGGDRPSFREKRSFTGDRFDRPRPSFNRASASGNDERLQSIEAKLDVILSQLRRLNREKKNDVSPDVTDVENLDLGE